MFKALTPIMGILVAVGLYFTYVQPTLEDIKMVEAEAAEYDEAIMRASELQQRIDELMQQRGSISTTELERLEAFIPDRVDEVSILIDLNELANSHNLVLADIEVGTESEGLSEEESPDQSAFNDPAVNDLADPTLSDPFLVTGDTGQSDIRSQYSTLDIGFSVTGTYDDFRAFLSDLEKSLVLMEVMEISVGESEGDLVSYTMTVRLFSINAPTS